MGAATLLVPMMLSGQSYFWTTKDITALDRNVPGRNTFVRKLGDLADRAVYHDLVSRLQSSAVSGPYQARAYIDIARYYMDLAETTDAPGLDDTAQNLSDRDRYHAEARTALVKASQSAPGQTQIWLNLAVLELQRDPSSETGMDALTMAVQTGPGLHITSETIFRIGMGLWPVVTPDLRRMALEAGLKLWSTGWRREAQRRRLATMWLAAPPSAQIGFRYALMPADRQRFDHLVTRARRGQVQGRS